MLFRSEGQAWSVLHLAGSGEFAYHAGYLATYTSSDKDLLKALGDWEREIRDRVAQIQIENFRGKIAFTLVSTTGALRVVPPSADLRLYLLGFLTNQKMDFGGDAVKGQVVAEHVKAFRKDSHPDYPNQPTGLDSVAGIGKASPEFIREMLAPLRTVKPQPLTDLPPGVSDVRFHRVWASGKNGVRVQGSEIGRAHV